MALSLICAVRLSLLHAATAYHLECVVAKRVLILCR